MESIVGAIVAAPLGFVAVGYQHHLYTEQEFRENPRRGSRGLLFRVAVALLAAAAAALALRGDHYDLGPGVLSAVFAGLLILTASTDVERKRIPNRISYPLALAALAVCWAWPDRSVADILVGGGVAIGFGVLLFVLGIVLGGILGAATTVFGMGDVKLIIVLGLLVGFPALISAVFIGILAAGVPSFVLILMGRGRTAFPYGPFLVTGGLIVLLFPGRFV